MTPKTDRPHRPLPGDDFGMTSVQIKLAQQKYTRRIGLVILCIVGIPVLTVAVLLFASDTSAGFALGIVGVILTILIGTMLAVLPFLIVIAIFAALGYAVYTVYRKPSRAAAGSMTAPPPASLERDAATRLIETEARTPPTIEGVRNSVAGDHIPTDAELAADLAELETLRAKTAAEAARRTKIFVPLTIAAVVGFWFLTGMGEGGQGSPIFGFLILVGMAGFGAWVFANSGPGTRYAKAFKEKLMPRLLSRYGSFRYSAFEVPALDRLCTLGVLPSYNTARGDDGIEGTYQGHPVRIGEIELVRKNGKKTFRVFSGLLIEFRLPAPLSATTVVLDDAAPAPGAEREGLSRIRLEDPVFEKVYRVYGSDQVLSRAMLTPATMERLLQMGDGKGFLPPHLLAEGDRMVFAMKHWGGRDLFEPPSLSSHDVSQQFTEQEMELAGVFKLIDVMIDMQAAAQPGAKARSLMIRQ